MGFAVHVVHAVQILNQRQYFARLDLESEIAKVQTSYMAGEGGDFEKFHFQFQYRKS